ncbi:sensor histidine kinase [Bacillus tianshenii]|nr:sensor histidine kinase [Bacillus tianshenii]
MLPIHKETHWVYKTAQITRIGWFIFHFFILVFLLLETTYFWLLLPLFFASFLIPQWSGHQQESLGVRHYPLLELIFSGVFLIVGCYLLGEYSSFLAYPALCAAIYSKPGKERKFLWLGFSVVPFLAVLAIGIEHLGLGVIDGFFFFGIGIAVAKVLEAEKKTKLLLEENRRQNQLLEEYAKQVEKVTLLEERNRLAKDLHDTIGHTYTSVIMGLDAASYLLEASPDKAKDQVERLSKVMRESLNEIRSHIHKISPYENREEATEQLQRIAREFSLHTSTEVEFHVSGSPEKGLSSQGKLTFVRCLQEALTNAVRHGQAKKVLITLKEENLNIVLEVKDNGRGNRNILQGYGIKGMKDRLESLQGGIHLESDENEGTKITCYIPVILGRLRGEVEEDDKSADCG